MAPAFQEAFAVRLILEAGDDASLVVLFLVVLFFRIFIFGPLARDVRWAEVGLGDRARQAVLCAYSLDTVAVPGCFLVVPFLYRRSEHDPIPVGRPAVLAHSALHAGQARCLPSTHRNYVKLGEPGAR